MLRFLNSHFFCSVCIIVDASGLKYMVSFNLMLPSDFHFCWHISHLLLIYFHCVANEVTANKRFNYW